MIKVKDIEKEIFNTEYISIFPKECKDCGSDMIVTDSLTHLLCSNPFCKGKVYDRLNSMLLKLGIFISDDKIKGFIDKYDISSPYYIFLYNPKKDGLFTNDSSSEESENVFKDINRKRVMMLWEFIYIGFLPFLRESAEVLFNNYDKLEDFYVELENRGMGYIQEILHNRDNIIEDSINEKEILTQTILIYDTLNTYKKEIIKGTKGIIIPKVVTYIPIYFASGLRNTESIMDLLQRINSSNTNKFYAYRTYNLNNAEFIYWDDNKNKKKTELMRYIDAYHRDKEIISYDNIEIILGGYTDGTE